MAAKKMTEAQLQNNVSKLLLDTDAISKQLTEVRKEIATLKEDFKNHVDEYVNIRNQMSTLIANVEVTAKLGKNIKEITNEIQHLKTHKHLVKSGGTTTLSKRPVFDG